MPDYGPTPKVREVDFGTFNPVPKIKEVGQVHRQSYIEAQMMIDIGLWAGKVAEKQARETGKRRGLKGMPLTRFTSEVSNQAANDAMEWAKEEFATWGLRQVIMERGLK